MTNAHSVATPNHTYSVLLSYDSQVDVWVADVPVFGAVTQGDTVEHALDMAREMIDLMIEDMVESGEPIPIEINPLQLHTISVDHPT